jgi:hypothetical protein
MRGRWHTFKMTRIYLICLLIFGFISCDNSDKNLQREAFIYNGMTFKKTESFVGTLIEKENNLIYNYVSKSDSTKNISVEFNKNTNQLHFGSNEYIILNQNSFSEQSLSQNEFDYYYSRESYADATGPILFNSEYGLLAINNVFGPTIIFLNKNSSDNLQRKILTDLTEWKRVPTTYNVHCVGMVKRLKSITRTNNLSPN